VFSDGDGKINGKIRGTATRNKEKVYMSFDERGEKKVPENSGGIPRIERYGVGRAPKDMALLSHLGGMVGGGGQL
jgi:hypothetical protein